MGIQRAMLLQFNSLSPIIKSELTETVKATLPDSVSITGVTVFADKDRTYQVNLSKPRRAFMFIDQYSGQITGKYERLGFSTARIHMATELR